YPNLVPYAVERTKGTNVKVAAVATAFPSGQSSMDVKLLETREVIDAGAHEVDMVINRGAFLSGRYAEGDDEVVRVKEVCAGRAHLKVILETGELGTYDNIRRASLLAIAGGADFIKTSTGKAATNATLPVQLCMLEVIRDVHEETGRVVGMKAAGGIRQGKAAGQRAGKSWRRCRTSASRRDIPRAGSASPRSPTPERRTSIAPSRPHARRIPKAGRASVRASAPSTSSGSRGSFRSAPVSSRCS